MVNLVQNDKLFTFRSFRLRIGDGRRTVVGIGSGNNWPQSQLSLVCCFYNVLVRCKTYFQWVYNTVDWHKTRKWYVRSWRYLSGVISIYVLSWSLNYLSQCPDCYIVDYRGQLRTPVVTCNHKNIPSIAIFIEGQKKTLKKCPELEDRTLHKYG